VLRAIEEVPRERFVPDPYRRRAYADSALPIGHGQTISQPWIVAAICQGLELLGPERVLEVGTGSGYSAAVLAVLAREVITIERVEELAAAARETLGELGIENVEVIVGDGSAGFVERAPYEAIAVHATAPSAPPTLIEQLGGRTARRPRRERGRRHAHRVPARRRGGRSRERGRRRASGDRPVPVRAADRRGGVSRVVGAPESR
jgi:protein-L-isoaspartate(D-aspartate) O-methyltransferase